MGKKKAARERKKKTTQDEKLKDEQIQRRNEIVEQQDAELELLSQMYVDEFVSDDDETDYDYPKAFRVRLVPRSGDDTQRDNINATITLCIRLPREYPFVNAITRCTDVVGISLQDSHELDMELKQLAIKKTGEVCAFELVGLAHDFLDAHCNPGYNLVSVHDEMTSRKQRELKETRLQEEALAEHQQEQDRIVLQQRVREEKTKKKARAALHHEKNVSARAATCELIHDDIFHMEDVEDATTSDTASFVLDPPDNPVKPADKHEERETVSKQANSFKSVFRFPRGLLDPQNDSSSDSSDSSLSCEETSDDDDDDFIDISMESMLATSYPSTRTLNLRSLPKSLPVHKEVSHARESGLSMVPASVSSRYGDNFHEIGLLGCGGFGAVFKARNKLDGNLYGIKKVKLIANNVKARTRIFREVTTIARLHHKYIVRYYQAWVEGDMGSFATMGHHSSDIASSSVHDWLDQTAASELQHDSDDDTFISDFSPISTMMHNIKHSPSTSMDTNAITECLYIQFEYCPNKTLRDEIDECSVAKPDKNWRVLRQILEALEYIHEKGIVHRDIKPRNVFFDENEDIKLGDFGLATASTLHHHELHAANVANDADYVPNGPLLPADCSVSATSLSNVAGTPYYRAPEQETSTMVDDKADMYAVGVLFFEMWTSFTTLMERHEALTNLRHTGLVSSSHAATMSEASVKTIQWLLSADTKQRPTAHELLHSGLVPLSEDAQYLREALHALTSANSAFRARVIDVLFRAEYDRAKDLTYDINEHHNNTAVSFVHTAWRMKYFDRVERVLRNHGALNFTTPLLTPKITTVSEVSSMILLDTTGTLVQLPHSLTVPFARFVALHKVVSGLRRYSIAPVFRQNPVGGAPSETIVCNFDIVFSASCSRKHHAIYMCEAIGVADKIISTLSSNTTRHCIYVNHLLLLEAVLDAIVPQSKYAKAHAAIGTLLAQLGRVRWNSMRRTLSVDYQVSDDDINLLETYITMKGGFDDTFPKLENFLKAHALMSTKLTTAIESLQTLFRLLVNVKLTRKVLLHAGVVADIEVYRHGIVFQVVQEGKRSHQRTEKVAIGGCFEDLIERFRSPSTTDKVCAIGVSVFIEQILSSSTLSVTSSHTGRSKKIHSSGGVDQFDDLSVMLFANSGKLIEQRFAVASLLWDAGIRAEYSFPDHMHNASTMPKYCRTKRCRWLVVFRPKLFTSGLVRLCDLLLTTQDDIEVHNIVHHVLRMKSGVSDKDSYALINTTVSSKEPKVEFLHHDTAFLRSHQCMQHVRTAQSMAIPLVGALEPQQFAILGVYTPIDTTRQLCTAYYTGGVQAMNAFVSGCHSAKQHLLVLAKRLSELISQNRLVLRYVFIFIVEERRYDLLCI